MNIKINEIVYSDILIVGGGLAGIKAAYECSKSNLNVLVAIKKNLCSGSSFYPLTRSLGCQVTLKDSIDREYFLEEIDERGCGMNSRSLCTLLVDNIRKRVEELPDMGINARKLSGGRIACMAKRPRDIVLLENWNLIRKNLYDIFKVKKNVKIIEDINIISLVKKNNKVCGAVGVTSCGKLVLVNTKAVILATGGLGDLYKHNLNSSDVDGSGHVLALNAGARLINMEFIQFIPGFIKPLYKTLLGEQTLMFCRRVMSEEGGDALKEYLPDGISTRECLNERSKHGPFTSGDISKYFDIAMMSKILKKKSEDGFILEYSDDIWEDDKEFTKIYVNWLKDMGIDIVRDKIYVAPFAHASNGGIYINEQTNTGIEGLFAAGEAAGGIHGADRLGGNATASCLVFGKIAADNAVLYSQNSSIECISEDAVVEQIESNLNSNNKSEIEPDGVMKKIREIMWFYGNVVRSQSGLEYGLNCIADIKDQYNALEFINQGKDIKLAVKANNFITLSEIMLNIMLLRKESRGSHFRQDYPCLDNESFDKRIAAEKCSDNSVKYDFI